MPMCRKEIIERLEERGIDFDELAEAAKQPDADPFDLLCHVAYNAPLRTRRERAERLRKERKDFFDTYSPEARHILNELLEKYAEYGTAQFTIPDMLKVPPISEHGNVIEIVELVRRRRQAAGSGGTSCRLCFMPRNHEGSKGEGTEQWQNAETLNTQIHRPATREPHQVCRDIMRKDKGLNGDLDRLPMLTWIMFLKFLDDMEQMREEQPSSPERDSARPLKLPTAGEIGRPRKDGITGDELIASSTMMKPFGRMARRGRGCSLIFGPCKAQRRRRRDVIASVFRGVRTA